MNYYIIAGEASGDLHGSNLIRALKEEDKDASFRFWGGDLMMEASGEQPVKHYSDLAFMGFIEVVLNLRTILNNIKFCKKDILAHKPDVLILIDYPGFNLRICEFAKEHGIRVVYYISPQLWAWKENRVEKIKKYVDQLLVILPFEEDYYKKHDVVANYVGHPLLDALSSRKNVDPSEFRQRHGLDQKEIIALLPGSRKQEISKMLNEMLSVEEDFKDYQFVIAGAPGIEPSFYMQFVDEHVHFVSGATYDLLQVSKVALVASGTATLETALLNCPQVVCYKGNPISVAIARRLVKNIRFISLVNLIMDREVVKELIQGDLTKENLRREVRDLIDGPKRLAILESYQELHRKLGDGGASKRAAELITKEF